MIAAIHPAARADELRAAGATGVRIVAFDDERFFTYAHALLEAGLEVAIVIARESCADDDFGGWASFYAQRIRATAWIPGNEEDAYLLAAPSPPSWKMTPAEYAAFWDACAYAIRAVQPDAHVVVGGLVSGQPSYLDELLPLLDPVPYAVDIHPYGRDAAGADDLFAMYRSVALPEAQARFASYRAVLDAHGAAGRLYCLEWNRPPRKSQITCGCWDPRRAPRRISAGRTGWSIRLGC